MNKYLAYTLILALVILLIACGKEVIEQTIVSEPEPQQTVEPPQVEEEPPAKETKPVDELLPDETQSPDDQTMIGSEELEVCEYRWGCINETHRARQWEDCHWDYITYCEKGCVNGNCRSFLAAE